MIRVARITILGGILIAVALGKESSSEASNSIEISGTDVMMILNCGIAANSCIQEMKKKDNDRKKTSTCCKKLKAVQKNCCRNKSTKDFIDKNFLEKQPFNAAIVCETIGQVIKVCDSSPQCVEQLIFASSKGKESIALLEVESVDRWSVEMRETVQLCCKDKNFTDIDLKLFNEVLKNKTTIPQKVQDYCNR